MHRVRHSVFTQCHFVLLTLVIFAGSGPVSAAEAIPPIPRRLPPSGKPLPDKDQAELTAELARLEAKLAKHAGHELAPDVEIFTSAVALALAHDEFYRDGDAALATKLLQDGERRLEAIARGEAPWTTQHGTFVRGYRSEVDGSVQPYGLVIPEQLALNQPVPLYVWLHGRGDSKTNLAFLAERQSKQGQVAPDDAIVLHPFGRHCVGFKSAGEIDVLEAIDDVCKKYPIDRRRIVLMGFSMGGAGCWHIGAHYADRFVAMSPGAGFAETAQYQNLKPDDVPWYERKLWGVYDVPCYTRNLFNLPVIAYSGENDKQIQAARVMEQAFLNHDRKLTHLIGPGMGHKYHLDTLREILQRVKKAREAGLNTDPPRVFVQTRTLRYHQQHWVDIRRLEAHWRNTTVDALRPSDDRLEIATKNVTALRLTPDHAQQVREVAIDGQSLRVAPPSGNEQAVDRIDLVKRDGQWQIGTPDGDGLAKTPGLQGPIDDAFLEPFLVVLPSGNCRNEAVQQWVDFESTHFVNRWRALFRGAPRVKRDTEVTAEDRKKYHLLLWGDPQSNALIQRLTEGSPIRWNADAIEVGEQKFSNQQHVPVFVYPNREAPGRYIVVNSGPTFREGHDRTNSLQNPKLPDWAIVDISQAPDALAPGKIAAADFFDEHWQLHRPNSD